MSPLPHCSEDVKVSETAMNVGSHFWFFAFFFSCFALHRSLHDSKLQPVIQVIRDCSLKRRGNYLLSPSHYCRNVALSNEVVADFGQSLLSSIRPGKKRPGAEKPSSPPWRLLLFSRGGWEPAASSPFASLSVDLLSSLGAVLVRPRISQGASQAGGKVLAWGAEGGPLCPAEPQPHSQLR